MTLDTTLAIALLQKAHYLIDTGEEVFICFALDTACDEMTAGATPSHGIGIIDTADRLTNYVQHKLGAFAYLGQWLDNRLDRPTSTELRTLARMAWVDKMLDTLKTEGRLP